MRVVGSSCDSSPKEGSDLIIPRLTSRDYSTKSFMDTTIQPPSDNEEDEHAACNHSNNHHNNDPNKSVCDKTQTEPVLPLLPRLMENEFSGPPKLNANHVINTTATPVAVKSEENVDQLSALFE